ncbi:MAG: hypothetical protein ACRDZ4_01185 [Egibacteraceae bacterium]
MVEAETGAGALRSRASAQVASWRVGGPVFSSRRSTRTRMPKIMAGSRRVGEVVLTAVVLIGHTPKSG